ncbi:helix-turn-helix domain-containing protein [Labrys neptuniae]
MTDIRIPSPAEVKARKARLWDRAEQKAKPKPKPQTIPQPQPLADATKEYKLAYSTDDVVPFIPLIKVDETPARRPAFSTWEILIEVSRETGVSIDELRGNRRYRFIAKARQRAYYEIASRRRDLSWHEIGHALRKDHTSAMYGVRAYAEEHGLPVVNRAEFKSKPNYKELARRATPAEAEA